MYTFILTTFFLEYDLRLFERLYLVKDDKKYTKEWKEGNEKRWKEKKLLWHL